MALTNSSAIYGTVARTLHWATSLLILVLLVLGVYMHDLPHSTDGEATTKVWFFSLHKTLGMIAFALALIRLLWSLSNTKPHPLAGAKPLQVYAAETVHWMLYAGILITPLAGYLHHLSTAGSAPIWLPVPQSLGFIPQTIELAELSGTLHFFSAGLMTISIVAHILGAVYHAVVIKDDTLNRMLPFAKLNGDQIAQPASETKPALTALGIFGVALLISGTFLKGDATQNVLPAMMSSDAPSSWNVDYADSSLEIQILQMGDVVAGSFGSWKGFIEFDPNDLETSKITAIIELGSLDLGMVTQQALSNEFLDITNYATAIWTSDSFTETDKGQYRADGILVLNGIEVPVALDFSLSFSDDMTKAFAEGIADVNRNDFKLGAEAYPTEASLGFIVRVKTVIKAVREQP